MKRNEPTLNKSSAKNCRGKKIAPQDQECFLWLLNKVNVIPWEFDIGTFRFTYVGPQAENLLGYPLEEWYCAGFWTNHLHPEDLEDVVISCREAAARGEDHVLDYRMLAADGKIVWIRDIISVILKNGNPETLRGFMFDITKQKQAEEELENAYHTTQTIIEKAPFGIYIINEKGNVEYVNPAMVKIAGDYYNQVINLNVLKLPTYRKNGLSKKIKAGLRGKHFKMEAVKYTSYFGRKTTIRNFIGIPFIEQGNRKLLMIVEDITQAKQTEDELIKHQHQLETKVKKRTVELTEINEQLRKEIYERKQAKKFSETVINSLPGVFYLFNEEGNILQWNKNLEKFSGYSAEDISRLKPIDFIARENRDIITESIKQVFIEGEAAQEAKLLAKNGKKTYYYFTGIRMVVGERKYVVGVGLDISKRKKAEKAVRKSEAELKTKTKSLEETNTALRVLLKKRNEDKNELEEEMYSNLKQLVMPYLEKLKKIDLGNKNNTYLNMIKSNLNDITSSFSRKFSSNYYNLTPTEIQIANYIKFGKNTKEIAELMCLSPTTIQFHRRNIRGKLNIKNKKTNLRTHLSSIE
jgi:PAS domain S-box-containing protein